MSFGAIGGGGGSGGGGGGGLVADAINDGTTTVAPSQNAVFDALALKITNPGGANDDFLQRKAGAWTSRTPAQVKADMSIGVGDVSGFDEQVRDVVGTALVAGSNVTITANDGSDTITIASTGGGGGAVDLSPPLPAGKYSHGIPGALGYAGATLSAGNIGAFLVYIPQSFDRIACTSTGSPTGATMRLGLYNIGSDGYPGAAIVTPSGTLNTGTPGVKEYTVSQGPIGWCFAVYQSGGSNGSTLRSTATTGLVALAYPFSQPDTSATVNTLIYSSRTDAALPSDLTGFTWSSTTTGTFQVFQYRAA